MCYYLSLLFAVAVIVVLVIIHVIVIMLQEIASWQVNAQKNDPKKNT